MCLRASDPAGHHGWGGRWMRCGRRPGFRGDPPYLVRQAQVPFPGEFIPPALSPPPTRCGSSTSAGMPSAASRMGVEALPGAFPGKGRGGTHRDCRKPREIADLTLSSGRGPGRVSPQVLITSWKCAKNQVVVNQVVVRRCRIGTASGERSPTREKQPSLEPTSWDSCSPAFGTNSESRRAGSGRR